MPMAQQGLQLQNSYVSEVNGIVEAQASSEQDVLLTPTYYMGYVGRSLSQLVGRKGSNFSTGLSKACTGSSKSVDLEAAYSKQLVDIRMRAPYRDPSHEDFEFRTSFCFGHLLYAWM